MSDYLRNLAARSLGLARVVQPRLAPLFAAAPIPFSARDVELDVVENAHGVVDPVATPVAQTAPNERDEARQEIRIQRELGPPSAVAAVLTPDPANHSPAEILSYTAEVHTPTLSEQHKARPVASLDSGGLRHVEPIERPFATPADSVPDAGVETDVVDSPPIRTTVSARSGEQDEPERGATRGPQFDAMSAQHPAWSAGVESRKPAQTPEVREKAATDAAWIEEIPEPHRRSAGPQAPSRSLAQRAEIQHATALPMPVHSEPVERPHIRPNDTHARVETASPSPSSAARQVPVTTRAYRARGPEAVPPHEEPAPTIHVSIGRVEIRAMPAPVSASPKSADIERRPSRLEAYLRRHANGSDK